MAVNPKIECFWRDLVTEYCHGFESSSVFTPPPFFVETLPGRSNPTLPPLTLHMHPQEVIPTFLTSNIYIGLYFPMARTLEWPRSYEMVKVLPIFRTIRGGGIRGNLNFRLLGDSFWYWRREGFRSRREFRSLYKQRSQHHPLIFAKQFSCCRLHSMCDFHPICYIATVDEQSNHHAGYKYSYHTSTQRTLIVSCCILPPIRHCCDSQSPQQSWKSAYPHA